MLSKPLTPAQSASLRAEAAAWPYHNTEEKIEASVKDKILNLSRIERDGYVEILEDGYNGRPPRMGYTYLEGNVKAWSVDGRPAALIVAQERGIAPVLDWRGIKSWERPYHETGMTVAQYVAAAIAAGATLVSGGIK